MASSHVCGRTLAAWFIAFGMVLAIIPTASADDAVPPEPPLPGPAVDPNAPAPALPIHGAEPASVDPAAGLACGQFAQVLDHAAINYSDFADSIAFGGPRLNFADPVVGSNNVVGRTALREAAAAAMGVAGTPGLRPEIANPMRSWSLHATKLLLVMGIHSGSDTIDNAASQLNDDAYNVQMACAQAGAHA